MNRFHLLFAGICLGFIFMAYAPAAAGQMTEKVLYQFRGDSHGVISSLIRDSAGNFYGTTYYGGTAGHGTVFKLDPTGNQTVLHTFAGTDGSFPLGGSLWTTWATFTGQLRRVVRIRCSPTALFLS
jgi:uncharacterized repeat protein (TIGR03803 family)